MKITLMHPPLDDPTLPYHANAYLKGHLLHNGFANVSMRDINVEFVNYCMEEPVVECFYAEGERRLGDLGRRNTLSFREQEEFYALWTTNRIPGSVIQQVARNFRDEKAFLDFETYLESVRRMNRYFHFLGALSYPAEITNFKQMSRSRYSMYNLRDLFDQNLREKICYPFMRFFEERLCLDEELAATDCFGISIVYDHQVAHALTLAGLLRKVWPEKMLLLGGTSISQIYKHLKDKSQLRHFFSLCDAIVVGEGETAICEIADSEGSLASKKIPNTITYDALKDEVLLPTYIHYENVPVLGKPVYDYSWDLYLSPARGINYAPTRGCYWNRCTFCDYGLNTDRPTSPWRERPIDRVITDLADACEAEGIRYVYFAVDVMAPSYLERLSDAIVDAGLDIRWSAELRMEKIFSRKRCQKMADGGCVCVSFGMESGNQRILDLIDKGTKVSYMAETMKNFAESGIAVQLMAFTDFPTETEAERGETFKFIEKNKDFWSTGGMGIFLLTGTSMIAKDPAKFGITLIDTADADVARALAYRVDAESERKILSTEDSDASFDESGGAFPRVLGRPWAGGTDTLHSMIYYFNYGRAFFRDHPIGADFSESEQAPLELEDCVITVSGRLSESAFDIGTILENRAAYGGQIAEMLQAAVEPTYSALVRWESTVPVVSNLAEGRTYWITSGDRSVRLDRLVFKMLQLLSEKRMPLREALGGLNRDLRSRLLEYLRRLESSGMVSFQGPDGKGKVQQRTLSVDGRTACREVKMIRQPKPEDLIGLARP